jgi:fluoride exporter
VLIACLLLGAAIGAPARYLLDGAIQDRIASTFPWGTLTINVSGSFVLGVVTGLALYHGLGDVPRALLGTGLCGAYTTFSTFSYETVQLFERGEAALAVRNLVASNAAGLVAAGLGLALAAL